MIDRQQAQSWFATLRKRFEKAPPQAILIYGRRCVPAPGFSLSELAEAAISVEQARALGLDIDQQRMNSIGANVEAVEEFARRNRT
jgi:ribosomal protein L13E